MNQLLAPVQAGRSPLPPGARLPCVGWPARAEEPLDQERRRVEQSIRYMVGHLTERLNITTLAAFVHVSPSAYFAMFKRQTGFAPIDLFIHLRMHRACGLLDTTELTVKEIATSLGYEDAFYFSRLFKSVTDVAPTDYRLLSAAGKDAIRAAALPAVCRAMGPALEKTPPPHLGALRPPAACFLFSNCSGGRALRPGAPRMFEGIELRMSRGARRRSGTDRPTRTVTIFK